MAELARLHDAGRPVPDDLDAWAREVALGRRKPPAANNNTARDDAIEIAMHWFPLVFDATERLTAKVVADALRPRFPEIDKDRVRVAWRARRPAKRP